MRFYPLPADGQECRACAMDDLLQALGGRTSAFRHSSPDLFRHQPSEDSTPFLPLLGGNGSEDSKRQVPAKRFRNNGRPLTVLPEHLNFDDLRANSTRIFDPGCLPDIEGFSKFKSKPGRSAIPSRKSRISTLGASAIADSDTKAPRRINSRAISVLSFLEAIPSGV